MDPEERLLFSHTTLPGIYRAVVRYGYMDRIEHNAAFVQTMSAQVRAGLFPLISAPQPILCLRELFKWTPGFEQFLDTQIQTLS